MKCRLCGELVEPKLAMRIELSAGYETWSESDPVHSACAWEKYHRLQREGTSLSISIGPSHKQAPD
jgi:hypothetical protein